MRSSDWSSDVCSSDLQVAEDRNGAEAVVDECLQQRMLDVAEDDADRRAAQFEVALRRGAAEHEDAFDAVELAHDLIRSEEHTSELQSLMRVSYDVSCLKKKPTNPN